MCLLGRVDPFSEGSQKQTDRVASLKRVSIPYKPNGVAQAIFFVVNEPEREK